MTPRTLTELLTPAPRHDPRALVARLIDATPPGPVRDLYVAVRAWASAQILQCLDPRHPTTLEQAVDAVYDTSPAAELLAIARATVLPLLAPPTEGPTP